MISLCKLRPPQCFARPVPVNVELSSHSLLKMSAVAVFVLACVLATAAHGMVRPHVDMAIGVGQGRPPATITAPEGTRAREIAQSVVDAVPGVDAAWMEEAVLDRRGASLLLGRQFSRERAALVASLRKAGEDFVPEGDTTAVPIRNVWLGSVVEEVLASMESEERRVLVCESGFYRGMSTLRFLTSSPRVDVISFDPDTSNVLKASAAWLEERFGKSRFRLVSAPTSAGVASVLAENPALTCDIMFVDGDHSYEGAVDDLRAFRRVSRCGKHVLVLDDVNTEGVRRAWAEFVAQGGAEADAVLRPSGVGKGAFAWTFGAGSPALANELLATDYAELIAGHFTKSADDTPCVQ